MIAPPVLAQNLTKIAPMRANIENQNAAAPLLRIPSSSVTSAFVRRVYMSGGGRAGGLSSISMQKAQRIPSLRLFLNTTVVL
ncbi:hypothetical protein JOE21_001131 [Desmospora profundinema]|uniref:Uncharacterized protein n=1 Tax=Desmospora profundinema TaxID=1571184 RepID=A0ABU1IK29_9BACL|nr:hypothetical protein [Desmospora profundinema]